MTDMRRRALGVAITAVVVVGVPVSLTVPAFAAESSATAANTASSRQSDTRFVGGRVQVRLTPHFEDILRGALGENLKLTQGAKATGGGLRFNGGRGTFDRRTGNFAEALHGQLAYKEAVPDSSTVKLVLKDFKIVKHGRTGEVLTSLSVEGGPAPVDEPLTWATFTLPKFTYSHGVLKVKDAPLTLTREALQLFSLSGQPETRADLGTTSFSVPVR
jgi:hypothetical protein